MNPQPDPSLDLVLDRTVPISRELVWRAWTEPELLKQWFTPKPWQSAECEVDLRPGGKFRTLMRGPEGEEFDGTGCYLEVEAPHRLVWTSALGPDYRPQPASVADAGAFFFTAILTFEEVPEGTRYRAHLMHADQEACSRHNGMGFEQGWGTALDQLIELMQTL